ncbi:MAG TPA: homoserine kinase [Thermoanaerobaculia bacterium]|nr:homoserine kinase [Thermoanaerobaculia bacterium]
MKASAFAPGSIGNVGPGFDVLGLAIGGIGVRVEVELIAGEAPAVVVGGRDADSIPTDPRKNAAAIAAASMLRRMGSGGAVAVRIDCGLPVAGGMGASGASSAAGAFAAALAAGGEAPTSEVILAALDGEAAVAGRHLDNVAPSILGGLVLSRSVDPLDVVALPAVAPWHLALVTPQVRIETRHARSILPESSVRREWVQQMANAVGVSAAFARGDGALLLRALDDVYAEPRRAKLIPRFAEVKRAALEAGALGCSISGSGPTIFAIAPDDAAARNVAAAMQNAFGDIESSAHVGPIDRQGARRVEESAP